MASIVLCTAPKPFTDPDIARIQRNAFRSWRALGEEVEIVVVGREAGAEAAAREAGLRFVGDVDRNANGTPLIGSIFDRARSASAAPIVAYANADILLLDDFVEAVREVGPRFSEFLLVSRRWDLGYDVDLETKPGWSDRMREMLRREGRLHPPGGSDLFVFPRSCFMEVPELAVGRAGWDNWMIYEARRRRWPVVDVSRALTIVHQDHDYRHLPGGRPHYRLPETDANVRAAGGRRAILTLADADWEWTEGRPRRKRLTLARAVRAFELFPLLRLGSPRLANLTHAIVHPASALGEVRGWLAWKLGRPAGGTDPGAVR